MTHHAIGWDWRSGSPTGVIRLLPASRSIAYGRALFGRGLVKTAEDFGSQGSRPIYQDVLERPLSNGFNRQRLGCETDSSSRLS